MISTKHVLVTLRAKDANGTVTSKDAASPTTEYWVRKDKNIKFSEVAAKVKVTPNEKYVLKNWANNATGAKISDDLVITEALAANAIFVNWADETIVDKKDSPNKPSDKHVLSYFLLAKNGKLENKTAGQGLSFWVKKGTSYLLSPILWPLPQTLSTQHLVGPTRQTAQLLTRRPARFLLTCKHKQTLCL